MSEIRKCLQCGGDIVVGKNGIPTCKYCGTEYKDEVGGYSEALERIIETRQLREFIKAEELCSNLIEEQPESSEAHWQMLLATLGVVYVKDGGDVKPTFFSYSYDERESIEKNKWFKKTLEYAKTSKDRSFYEQKGKELDVILKEFFELTAKENSYQVFISFKDTDVAIKDGKEIKFKTIDREKAEELYAALKAKRYKVFFSPVSIEKDINIEGKKFEPRILKALQTSQVMVLIGSQTEYINAQWVQNEWRRYKYFIEKGKKSPDSLIIAHNPHTCPVPEALLERQLQCPKVDIYKDGHINEIIKRIEKVIRPGSARKESVEIETDFGVIADDGDFGIDDTAGHKEWKETVRLSPREEREFITAENFRQGGHFADALLQYDSVLKINGNNNKALWGKFCARIKAKNDSELKEKIFCATDNDYIILKRATELSPEEEYWHIVDMLIDALSSSSIDFRKQKKLLDFITNEGIIVKKRNKKLLAVLGNKYTATINRGEIDKSEEIFSYAKKLFLKTNLTFNIEYRKNYAQLLLKKKYFDYARKYFNKLAAASNDAALYLSILQCRLHSIDITQSKFNLTGSLKNKEESDKPKNDDFVENLSIDDIVVRIIVCDLKSEKPKLIGLMTQIVFYQIIHNPKNADQFIKLYIGCFNDLIKKGAIKEIYRETFLLRVADKYIELANFKKAKTHYDDVIYYNENSFDAHFGLLKCRLKAFDDIDIEKKRKKLLSFDEFNNAKTCANNAQYVRLMSIYNGTCSKSKTNRVANKAYTKKRRFLIGGLITILLIFIGVIIGLNVFNKIQEEQAYWAHFTLSENSEGYTLKKVDGADFSGELVLPSSYIGKPINSISELVFENCEDISSIIVPKSIVSLNSVSDFNISNLSTIKYGGTIEEWLTIDIASTDANLLGYAEQVYIDGRLLETLNIPEGVTEISKYAFSGCGGLTSITIPNSVTSIGEHAFYGSGLTSITISDSITSIGAGAFSSCSYLKNITIGNSVTNIGTEAFKNCTNLSSIVFNAVECQDFTEESNIFKGCGENGISVEIGNDVKRIPANLFTSTYRQSYNNIVGITLLYEQYKHGGGNLSMGEWIEKYYSHTAYSKLNVMEIVFSQGSKCQEIGTKAFYNTNIESITFPESISVIEKQAIGSCDNINKIIFEDSQNWKAEGTEDGNIDLTDETLNIDIVLNKYADCNLKKEK